MTYPCPCQAEWPAGGVKSPSVLPNKSLPLFAYKLAAKVKTQNRMDWPVTDTVSPGPAQTALEIENKRVACIQKSFTILHRWKDASHGEGFDVIVYPDAVVSLHPTIPSMTKVIVFPSSNAVKVRAICTTGDSKISRTLSSAPPRSVGLGGAPGARPPAMSSAENLSQLRIFLQDTKSNSDEASDHDIVLSWKESNMK